MRRLFKRIAESTTDHKFLHHIESIEVVVSKVLSVAMVVVILVAIFDLGVLLVKELFSTPYGRARFGTYHLRGLAEPPDPDYPFVLTTGRLYGHWHTQTKHRSH